MIECRGTRGHPHARSTRHHRADFRQHRHRTRRFVAAARGYRTHPHHALGDDEPGAAHPARLARRATRARRRPRPACSASAHGPRGGTRRGGVPARVGAAAVLQPGQSRRSTVARRREELWHDTDGRRGHPASCRQWARAARSRASPRSWKARKPAFEPSPWSRRDSPVITQTSQRRARATRPAQNPGHRRRVRPGNLNLGIVDEAI